MLDQDFAHAGAVDHVEHALGHVRLLGGANDRISHPFGSCHMSTVGLEHHRATGGQGGSGIATGGGERQGEIARAENGDRADTDSILTQVYPWQWLAFGQGAVDARSVEITTTQDLGEQAHLAAGASTLTLYTSGWQCRLASDQGDKLIVKRVQLRGDGLEKFRTAAGRQVAKGRVGGCGGLGGGVHFFCGGLHEREGQGFASTCIMASQRDAADGAACTADVVVTEDLRHLKGSCQKRGNSTPL
ncbi:hypothetical protein D3C76_906060 [compost metagenome]